MDEYAPGFSESVVGYDALAPPDLERIFGLTGGLLITNCKFMNGINTKRYIFSLTYIVKFRTKYVFGPQKLTHSE